MHQFKIKDEPFARGYLEQEGKTPSFRTASGLLKAAREMRINVNPATGLPDCGFQSIEENRRNMSSYYSFGSGGAYTFFNRLEEKAREHPEFAEDYLYIRDHMKNCGQFIWDSFTEEEKNAMKGPAPVTGTWGGTWAGHAVPNLVDVARYGTDAMRGKVNRYRALNPGKDEFYDSLLITLDAIDELGRRVGETAAREAARSEGDARRKLARLAHTFEYCTRQPAVTFADACAVYVMLFTFDGIDSPGHFDQYMLDFWRNSTLEESREALDDIWEFFHDTRTWNLCISGSDEHWNDLTNELSYEILDITTRKGYQTPNLTMRCHRNTPEKLLRAAYRCIATGIGLPALYNDEAVCPALERLGIPPADSHEYVMNGCNQIDIQGKSHMGLEDGEVNLAKAVELVFSNGVCTVTGNTIGVKTGDPADFRTFDEFFDAVKAQVRHLTDLACSMSNKSQKVYKEHTALPIRSLTIEGCVEKGLDYKNGGPLYGHGQILSEGLADAIDSVAAVKRYVYDEKRFTMKQLSDAIAADFEGYDEIFAVLRKSPLRFGNDDDYVDSIGKELIDGFNRYLLTIPTVRGGYFGGGCSPYVRSAWCGQCTGALPNGKKKSEFMFAESIGADPGKDVNGPTALLNSCLKFDQTLPTSGFVLNIKFDASLFNTKRGEEGFLALYRAYFGGKGQQLSVNVLSREDLLDAVKNPDAHRNLIVRVGGYSDYFVNLSPELQQNVIARTSYAL